VPRFFFDVHDGRNQRDDESTLCDDVQAAALEARQLLPQIARDEVPKDGERQTITVLVTDEDGHPVYSAALCFVGTWLLR
jgi:protocatechuate 3,4-dioxygenase beta subunit